MTDLELCGADVYVETIKDVPPPGKYHYRCYPGTAHYYLVYRQEVDEATYRAKCGQLDAVAQAGCHDGITLTLRVDQQQVEIHTERLSALLQALGLGLVRLHEH